MSQFVSCGVTPTNFQEVYYTYIQPKIRELDIFLKTSEAPYDTKEVAAILEDSEKNILHIMDKLGLTEINKVTFFKLITEVQSYIATLLTRQFSVTNSSVYTPQNIAYIYNLEKTLVEDAFYALGEEVISSGDLNLLFSNIKVSQYNFKMHIRG
ncbi:MAG: hypothetical protein ATN34_01665 [Epulopiscium sp. Nele67-Bin002]|nr:MAG: hypothetical protein BEN18_05285 [Epulopiscium sp. Nuni2H_MBin001]OON92452.1 MAG: hypothetical protein ATN34_01665 [Epulopiscium sp. Nele67-Bin002]OON93052.1 MAG: hypothetical protein ATN33_06195 [Epulopiscium sp. Nele67-Bin001]